MKQEESPKALPVLQDTPVRSSPCSEALAVLAPEPQVPRRNFLLRRNPRRRVMRVGRPQP